LKNKNSNYIFTLRKIFISLPKIKHTNNNINIFIFIFNKYKRALKLRLKKLNIILFKLKTKSISNIKLNKSNTLLKKIILNNILKNKTKYIFYKKKYLASIYLNDFKFNKINLVSLYNILYKLYNKKVNINITNMKHVYLDNSIFINSLITKLNDRKKGLLKEIKLGLKLVKIAKLNINYLNNKLENKIAKLSNYYNNYINDIDNKYKFIFSNMRNMHITGITLETKGRLTRRITASRSVYKIKQKGNLKNIYSNVGGLLTRGYIKSNINYIKDNSNNANGSFGISIRTNTQ
jgi:hypothetical protein